MSKPAKPPELLGLTVPPLPYLPRDPRRTSVGIGLVGCGAITGDHLRAYQAAGYNVVALCDVVEAAAVGRRDAFFPKAKVFTDHRDLLKLDDVQVVDVTTHPEVRVPLVADALAAGKHVLSQKPFVLDLDEGQRLADLAAQHDVLLAVNQNARWAPHFSWLREAVRAGLIGDVAAVHCGVHWSHHWVAGTPFEKIYHLILYDFAIHWFDFLTTVMDDRIPQRVYASTARSPTQQVMPPLLAQAAIEYDDAQATLAFDGHVDQKLLDDTYIAGSRGSLHSFGPDVNRQAVEWTTAAGSFQPTLSGRWFPDGFHGTMGELLCAIEERREPSHSARNNLRSLELCFAAVASALRHEPIKPGAVRKLPSPPK